MKSLFLAFLFIFSLTGKSTDLEDGFYFIMDKKNCNEEVTRFRNEKFCVTTKPFINMADIDSISVLKQAGKVKFFDVYLNYRAAQKLRMTIPRLRSHRLMAVIKGYPVGFVNFERDSNFTEVRFYANALEAEIVAVHQDLGEIVTNRSKR